MAGRHAQPRERIRATRRGKVVGGAATVLLLGTALCAWPALGDSQNGPEDRNAAQVRPQSISGGHNGGERPAQKDARRGETTRIPGLDAATRDRIPARSHQVVVVTGQGSDAHDASVVLYTREPGTRTWQAGTAWPAHNGARGWTKNHREGDLRSPQGVFTLSDAGGKLEPPRGTKLPYDRNDSFVATGTGVEGEPLDGAFDYVIAIDYNRVPGSSPLDPRRPDGPEKGGGIWLHVDHDGPTQGCVSLEPSAMRALLRTLDPDRHPVIVMAPSLR